MSFASASAGSTATRMNPWGSRSRRAMARASALTSIPVRVMTPASSCPSSLRFPKEVREALGAAQQLGKDRLGLLR